MSKPRSKQGMRSKKGTKKRISNEVQLYQIMMGRMPTDGFEISHMIIE